MLLRYILDILFLLFSASYTNYHFQFENVSSPTAGEAMEEQVDADRTETARASHTQHAETVRGEAEYLYGLASSQRLFTMQVIDSWRVSIYNKICKCMHDMHEMHESNYEYATELYK